MIASVNCYGGFLKTNPKILQTFFTYILEAQQFTLSKVTLHQVLSTQVNSSRLDKVQNMPVEKILSADFLSLEFVKSVLTIFFFFFQSFTVFSISTYINSINSIFVTTKIRVRMGMENFFMSTIFKYFTKQRFC